MNFLYTLEALRTPFLNAVFSFLTEFGGEVVFLAVAITVFWCISKKDGYYLLTTCFVSMVISQFLKLMYRVPRPWVKDPNFTIVESARADATGYSFPSGHTQNAVGTFGGIACMCKKLWVRIACIVMILLVALSRMYLGVHTPADVAFPLVTGGVLVAVLYPLFMKAADNPKWMYGLLAFFGVVAVTYTVFLTTHAWPADIDADNLADGIKNGYTMIGCVAAIAVTYWMDQKFIHFPVKAPLWAQALKLALGLLGVLIIRTVLKQPLLTLLSGHPCASAIRYFVMVIFAGGVWPMTFAWFERGCKRKK